MFLHNASAQLPIHVAFYHQQLRADIYQQDETVIHGPNYRDQSEMTPL